MNAQPSSIGSLSPSSVAKLNASLTDAEKAALIYDWPKWARPNQMPPPGDWDGWLIIAGRFGGKTRTGAEFVRAEVDAGRARRIALIGETSADGKDVMVQGESGLLAVCPPWNKPAFVSSNSKGRPKVTWPNGAQATLYDAREPDQLRGPQHDLIWFDEGAKYRYAQEVFDQAMFGLRLGMKPRWLMTTTPRPIKLIKALMKDAHVHVTQYSSHVNLRNIAPSVRANVIDRYAGTRLGRQEIDAEILEDIPGALWTRRNLDENRIRLDQLPPLVRLVVAIDPAITSGDSANETGIICAGTSEAQRGFLIEDASMRGTPDGWARRAIACYRQYEADAIIAECNQGGEMVERVLRSVAPDVPVRLVRATRGKYVRAEPIAALYEQGRVSHVGTFPELEDQMIAFTPETAALRTPGDHFDRTDACVWAFADLFAAITLPIRGHTDDDYSRYDPQGMAALRDSETGY